MTNPANQKLFNEKYLNIARPYARAAFEYAHEHNDLIAWKAFLNTAATISQDPRVSRMVNNPETSSKDLFELYSEVLSSLLDQARKNFLLLLTANKRLAILPEISELFNVYLESLEKMSKIRVVTAIDIEDAFRDKLSAALARRIHHEVTLQVEVNPAILGGAIIHIGDRVIDGSIRGQLNRLLNNLTG